MFFKNFFVFYHNSTICDIKQGYNRVMSDSSEEDRWKISVQNIDDIESLTDLENRTIDLYDPKFCYPDNGDASHVIGGYVQIKKGNCIQSMFKFNCPYINKRLNELEVYLQSRKTKSNTFSPLQKDFLPPPKKITLKKNNTIFPMKNKDLSDHDTRCIMSCGLMFDDIIMDYMKRTQSSKKFKQGYDFDFTQMDTDMIYIYRGTLQDLESLNVP